MDRPNSVRQLRPVPPVPRAQADVSDIDAVFRRYASYVAAIAFPLLGNEDETEDMIQEVFLVAVKGLERLREPEAVRGWLATVTVRLARERLRRKRLLRLVSFGAEAPAADLPARSSNPEHRLLLEQVYKALDTLPVEQRIAWTLRHIEGERLDRVAVLCGCSLATAKRRIAAAHESLQRVVKDG